MSERKFQILSLDGGGIKGLFSIAVLAAIEEDLDLKVIDYFDLIAGTSTGGIIAMALGLGISPKKIIEFYVLEGPKIFSDVFHFKKMTHWLFHKHSKKDLEKSLKKYFGNKKLGHSKKRLVIPSFNLGENDVYVFRTPHHPKLKRDYKVSAWKIAAATAAAPTYFSTCREVDNLRLVDGGIWANNPTMVSIVEAYGILKIPLERIRVFSIGASEGLVARPKWLDWGGKFLWAHSATEVILQGQNISSQNQASFFLKQENLIRLNPKVCKGEFDIDGIHKAEELIAKARHYSRIQLPLLSSFFKRKSRPFKPFYK